MENLQVGKNFRNRQHKSESLKYELHRYFSSIQKILKFSSHFHANPAPWGSGYHYCTTSFIKAWTRVLHRLKSCSQCVWDSWWWGSLTMVPARNKTKSLSSVNYTTKTIHHSSSSSSGAPPSVWFHKIHS